MPNANFRQNWEVVPFDQENWTRVVTISGLKNCIISELSTLFFPFAFIRFFKFLCDSFCRAENILLFSGRLDVRSFEKCCQNLHISKFPRIFWGLTFHTSRICVSEKKSTFFLAQSTLKATYFDVQLQLGIDLDNSWSSVNSTFKKSNYRVQSVQTSAMRVFLFLSQIASAPWKKYKLQNRKNWYVVSNL